MKLVPKIFVAALFFLLSLSFTNAQDIYFGLTEGLPGTDSYWFPDYLGDLDALLDRLSPDAPVDLLGHSMGGNVAMVYAGVRPERVRRLVNLEGFGLPGTRPAQAPTRYAAWLDELKQPPRLRDYASLDEVAQRLRQNNPRLTPERAAWLAPHWARPEGERWVIQGDPAHKRTNPVLYRAEEVTACWARITAPVLWVEARQTDVAKFWTACLYFSPSLGIISEKWAQVLPSG